MNAGGWQLNPVHGGYFSIDGGAAFGVVPKTVWTKVFPADENNLVRMTCNCLLARNGQHVVLIDTGYGGKYPPLDRKAYIMESGNPTLESLACLGVSPESIDCVLFTHLHFDHAGGATVKDIDGHLVPTFPNARYFVHRWEWEDAVSRSPELLAAYPQNNLLPLAEAGKVEMFDKDGPILPGVIALRTGGHTRGHTAFLFESDNGIGDMLFIGDLCPTRAHIKTLWNMSYEMFLLETRRKKRRILEEAAAKGQWLFLPHDPFVWACRIESQPGREFVATELWNRETT